MSAYHPLLPARVSIIERGIPFSEHFGDVYHSADGGIEQARQVFLGGNDLPLRWQSRECFVILETGFGLGLNFLATWETWRADPRRPRRLHFVSVEKHPLTGGSLATLHATWPALAPLAAQLRDRWPPLTPGFHRLHFEHGQVTLTLLFGGAEAALRKLEARADAIYLDGFAPDRNPEMWSPSIAKRLARLAAPDATLATWTVSVAVRDALAGAGFTLEKRPGFGRKRQMLTGRLAGHRPCTAPAPRPAEQRAVVVGAGLAGAAVCERLASRGWDVDLVERHPGPAREASGNLAGVVRPMLSRDDNVASRLSRACYLYALQQLRELTAVRWSPCGVLQLGRDKAHEALQRDTIAALGFPDDVARFVADDEASQLAGRPVSGGGWWFPGGGWANPPSLCDALLAPHRDRIRVHWSREAIALERSGDLWRTREATGAMIAEAPVVVLANAFDVTRLPQSAGLPLKCVRGQVSHLPGATLSGLRCVVCRDGYVAPPVDGTCCVGASFEHDNDPAPRAASHEGNLGRLARMLPGAASGLDPDTLQGRVGFRTATPDRLPMVGALPDIESCADVRHAHLRDLPRHPGLFTLTGLGARGLVWAQLAAELLASQIAADPLPLENDLVSAVDPARFHLRRQRRKARASP